jgi:Zn-dependent protease with chaperone function
MYRIRPTPVVPRSPLAVPRAPLRATIPRARLHQSRFYLHIALGRGAARFFLPSGVLIGVLHRWVVSPAFYRNIGLIGAGAGGIYLYNLEQVPVTGRWRFNIIPSWIEQALGAAAVERIRQECSDYFLPEDDPRVQTVKKVLARLLPYVEGERDLNWEVTVIQCPDNTAFVCPGGKIFFSTGILAQCRNENGIAVVLGHEIAHVVARHAAFVFPFPLLERTRANM